MSVRVELAERVARSFLHCFTDTTWDNLSEERRGHYLWIARDGLAGIADSVLEFHPASEKPPRVGAHEVIAQRKDGEFISTRAVFSPDGKWSIGFNSLSHYGIERIVAWWSELPDAAAIAEGMK